MSKDCNFCGGGRMGVKNNKGVIAYSESKHGRYKLPRYSPLDEQDTAENKQGSSSRSE